jgi:hypothetical protein
MNSQEIKEQTAKITPNQRHAMRSAQKAYAMALAWHATNKAIDLEARQEELNAFDYPLAEEWKQRGMNRSGIDDKDCIRDPKIDYLMADKYTDEYYHAVYNRRIAKGWSCKFKFKDGTPEYCVTADAESFGVLKLAEKVLIDCMLDTVPAWIRKDLDKARQDPYSEKLVSLAMSWDTNK